MRCAKSLFPVRSREGRGSIFVTIALNKNLTHLDHEKIKPPHEEVVLLSQLSPCEDSARYLRISFD
jgi:hypothetical protein